MLPSCYNPSAGFDGKTVGGKRSFKVTRTRGAEMKSQLAVAVVAALMLSGCATTVATVPTLKGYRQHTDLLVGQSTDELQIQRGVPTETTALPGDRKQWTYLNFWRHPGSEFTNGSTTETRSEDYKDANGKTQSRTVSYDIPNYMPPAVEISYCKTVFIIGSDNRVQSYQVEKEWGYWTECSDNEIGNEQPNPYRLYLDTLVGLSAVDLKTQWDAPAQAVDLSDGRKLWIYKDETEHHSEGSAGPGATPISGIYKGADGKAVESQGSIDAYHPDAPPLTWSTYCETRFVIGMDDKVQRVVADGDCAEQKPRTKQAG